MLRIWLGFLFIILTVACGPHVEQCKVNNTSHHPLTHRVHASAKDGLTNLDEGAYHSGGEYYLSLALGPNKVPVDVVADTGSSNLVVSGKQFHPSQGATSLNKTMNLGYASCGTSADLYEVSAGLSCGQQVKKQQFAYVENGTASCSHVLGLAYKQLATEVESTFLDNLIAENNMQDMFSMLYCGLRPGSHIVFGGYIENAPLASLQYVNIDSSVGYYGINVGKLTMDGKEIGDLTGSNSILDSGTTLVMIPDAMHTEIVNILSAKAPQIPKDFFTSTKPSDANYALTKDELGDVSLLPELSLELPLASGAGNLTLKIGPSTYFKALTSSEIIFGFRPSGGGTNLFGQVLIDNYYVDFNRAKNQIGFAPNTGLCK